MQASSCTRNTKTQNQASIVTENVENWGPDAWQPEGITVLGTPIGSPQYIERKMDERISKERELWMAIPTVPDLQCAWKLLVQSANPRANHTMRMMPPSQSAVYCRANDAGKEHTARELLGDLPRDREAEARQLSTLPMRMGGLGLRSAERLAPAAFWDSWADALAMISARNPEIASEVIRRLDADEHCPGCVAELREAPVALDKKGFWWRPSWPQLREERRPPQTCARDPSEWPHGWQYWASSVLDSCYREVSFLSGRSAACQAHLRSHSGRNAELPLANAPTACEFTILPHLFRVLLLERLRLPWLLTEGTCEACHELLDPLGWHRAALKKRAT